jgi:hypothetical protein
MTLVKSAPKKSFAQKTDFLGLKSVRKDEFFDAPFYLFKEKKFSSLRRDNELFWELKRSKMEGTTQNFEKWFFINRS